MPKQTDTAAEYAALTDGASALLDRADEAARQGDLVAERQAEDAAGRLLDAASRPKAS
ncbi:hypothetical protein [Streptomyces sp. NPDC005303]|uniref:hypothetical protein n=1 Tax=Streptomyces sp. NPDC005303 TaxID=3155713 RepID=UPI0033B0E49F